MRGGGDDFLGIRELPKRLRGNGMVGKRAWRGQRKKALRAKYEIGWR